MKKTDTSKTTPESGEKQIDKKKELGGKTSGSTLSALADDKNIILIKKFEELPFEKKKEYLHTVFGTVRGCTGFFDYRYTAGSSSHGTWNIGEGKNAHAFIREKGLYNEGFGTAEGENQIVVVLGNEIYTSPLVKYYDKNDRIDATNLCYKKILECSFDDKKNSFLVKIENASGGINEIKIDSFGIHKFEEELLGKFRVPVELFNNEEQQDKKEEEISPQQKILQQQKMYQKAVDILILEGRWRKVEKYIKSKEVFLSEDQKKQYIEYLFGGRNSYINMGVDDANELVLILQTISDKEYVKKIANDIICKFPKHNIKMLEEKKEMIQKLVDLAEVDMSFWGKKVLEYTIYRRVSYYDEAMDAIDQLIEMYHENKQERYQEIVKSIEKNFVFVSKEEFVEKTISKVAVGLGKDKDILYQEIFIKNIENTEDIGYDILKEIKSIIDKKGYDKQMYEYVFDAVCKNKKLWDQRSYSENIETIETLGEIKDVLKKKFPLDFFVDMFLIVSRYLDGKKHKEIYPKFWDTHIGDYSAEEKKIIIDTLVEKYIRKDTSVGYEVEDFLKRGLQDQETFLSIIEYFLDKKQNVSSADMFVDLLKKYGYLSDELQAKINVMYASISKEYFAGKEVYSNKYCPTQYEEFATYTQKELIEQYVQKKTDEYKYKYGNNDSSGDFYFIHIAKCLVNGGYTQEEIQTKITTAIDKGDDKFAAKLIKGLGLNIDKVRVNTLIQRLFKEERFDEAKNIASHAGLFDVRKVRIYEEKLKKKMLLFHQAKNVIKEYGLDSSYSKYVIDIGLDEEDILEVLERAEENDAIITDEQFEKYVGKNERLRKANEEKTQREKEDREAKNISMMKLVLEGKISCDIDYKNDQKYIFVRHPDDGIKIVSYNLEWHKDIARHVGVDDKYVMGGGRIVIDEEQKTVKLYGSSGAFGEVHKEYDEVVKYTIASQYPGYSLNIE